MKRQLNRMNEEEILVMAMVGFEAKLQELVMAIAKLQRMIRDESKPNLQRLEHKRKRTVNLNYAAAFRKEQKRLAGKKGR